VHFRIINNKNINNIWRRGWCRSPGKQDAAAEKRDAQDEFHSAAQARAWADGGFDADHGLAFDGVDRRAR
jgi:hypothetical protein